MGIGSDGGDGRWWSDDDGQEAAVVRWLCCQVKLKQLNLRNARLGRFGISKLQCLKKLDELNLAYSDVDDTFLGELEGLHGLHSLNVTGTALTSAAISEIEKAVPGIQVMASELH